MQDASRPYWQRLVLGMLAAIAIGVAVIAADDAGWAWIRGVPLGTLWWDEATVSQIAIVAMPFAILAVSPVQARAAWITAAVLTCAFWGYELYMTVRPHTGGGADIGLGILMLVSPIPITTASLLALAISRRGQSLST